MTSKARIDLNHLAIGGVIDSSPQLVRLATGKWVAYFTLIHRSLQAQQQIYCRLRVGLIAEEALLRTLTAGSAIALAGVLHRRQNRQGEAELMLQAKKFELLSGENHGTISKT